MFQPLTARWRVRKGRRGITRVDDRLIATTPKKSMATKKPLHSVWWGAGQARFQCGYLVCG